MQKSNLIVDQTELDLRIQPHSAPKYLFFSK